MTENLPPEVIRAFIYLVIFGVGAIGIAILLFLFIRSKSPASQFRVREADRVKQNQTPRDRRSSSTHHPSTPLLEGIRIDGTPHEILGVPPTATREDIQQAYRELMKRYHPDRVAPPGSRAWKDAQKIAEALNSAKEKLLGRK